LVPKLKNSAVSAISSAQRPAPIMVPTSIELPSARPARRVDDLELQIRAALEADKGNHDFQPNLGSLLLNDDRRLGAARACISEISGKSIPRRLRGAEHRVELVELSTRR
jgi:hypothetical protein